MNHRAISLSVGVALIVGAMSAPSAQAGGPLQERGSTTETFFDDVIFELCGIETMTTLTQHWSVKTYADGSEVVHVTRTYVSDDPRLPIEKGAATSFNAPDGTRRVVGKPIQLIGPKGGVRILDAGWIEIGDTITMRGPHPSFGIDLAPYYCP